MNDVENTFRTLQDKTLLVKSWRCSFRWHKWTMWDQQKVRESYGSPRQYRYCVNCNFQEFI